MAPEPRKKVGLPPGNAWDAMLRESEGDEATQAGEIEPGLEDGQGGGDKGIDAQTGSGGYSGDALEEGIDEALNQPDKPVDAEIREESGE